MTTAEMLTTQSFEPIPPAIHHAPLRVADDVYLIRQLQGEGEPISVYINSMVILGKEPIIVDTGTRANRRQWMEDVQSLVDPKDVRWIYLSHDDSDHTGALADALAACPNATLVSNWFQLERMTGEFNLPVHRMQWINDGEKFDAGGRELYAIRPPVFDSPTTRGLYDPASGLYWGSDCFATAVTSAVENAGDMDPEVWQGNLLQFGMAISPWISLVDNARFQRSVDRLAEIDIRIATGAHSPVISGSQVADALDTLRQLPSAPPFQSPVQADLEALLAEMTGHAV